MSQTITVNVVNSAATGPSTGYFIIPGNFTSLFFPGFEFTLFNGSEQLSYTTVSSSFATGNTQVNVTGSVLGSIVALGTFTAGTGPFVSGTYTPVQVTGGTGSGAQLEVVVVGPGPIATTGTITGGTLYNNGTYTAVPLTYVTSGSGTDAQATVTVSGGFVTNVSITNAGSGYAVGDQLTTVNTNIGGTGSGFVVVVGSVVGTISAVTLVNSGVGYSSSDTLMFGGLGYGTGNTIPVITASTTETGSIVLENNQPMFNVGQNVYVISAGNASCQTPWWSMTPTQTPIPSVQAGMILQTTVLYSNSTTSPTITYSVRLGNQPGVVQLDQSVVFIDLPTAIAAYQAELAS